MADPRTLSTWLRSRNYLPSSLRDFHDQKDVFKSLWEQVSRAKAACDGHDYLAGMTWVAAQVLVIDHFLHFMAAHGWTLQRSRVKVDGYLDLDETIKERRDREAAVLLEGMQP